MSGYCKSWAKDMTHDLLWHAKFIKELIEYFDSTWIMDQKLSCEEVGKCCANKKSDTDLDCALGFPGRRV